MKRIETRLRRASRLTPAAPLSFFAGMNDARTRAIRLVLTLLLLIPAVAHAGPQVLLIAGEPSHGPGEHRFPAGCALLARALNESGLGIRAAVSEGWPTPDALAAADALVLYSDGLDRHIAASHTAELRQHIERGRGLAVLHFALEPEPGELADLLLEALGGRFEENWSVNPVWTAEATPSPHELTRGVRTFRLEDEWYYHLRFRAGVVPVLQAIAPPESLGEDGPRSGNPAVRAAVQARQPQTLAWVSEQGGRRALGFTGGHFHRNWAQDDFRRLVLNGIAWIAHVAVPADGIASTTPTLPRYDTLDEAIARGDRDDVARHLAIDPLLATRTRASLSPLQQAILRNRTEIAALLLEAGADVDQPDRSRRTPLHLAVERGNLQLVEALLQRHARPNERDQMGWTPLHHAAAKDRVSIARALLQGGANPMTLSAGGGTPLHEAAASGSSEMVQLLLDADVDASVVSKTGVTALDVAREFKNQPAIEALSAVVSPPSP